MLVRFINLNKEVFQNKVVNGTIQEHIRKMLMPYEWETHVEIEATATYLNIPVYYLQRLITGEYKWHVVVPTEAPKLIYPYLVDDFVTEVRVPTHMELLYHTNTHYDCVVDSSTNIVCQTPPLLTGQESITVTEVL